ncbi:BNR-4 repeat-containing protein [Streptomyces antimycoticus]
MRPLAIAVLATALLGTAIPGAGAAAAPSPAVDELADTQLDAKAIYFESYDGLVNNNAFQKNGLLTYKGYQYVGWYTGDRSAVIGRRALSQKSWQTVTLPHRLTADDSHNVISMGISRIDGRLHLNMDSHSSGFFSVKSVAGLVDDPDHSLMNQESQATDSAGLPHALISYVPGRFGQCTTDYAADRKANGRTFHLFKDAAGSWKKTEIPVPPGSTQRSHLVFDRYDNAYAVMPYGRIVAASKSSGWTDWKTLFDGSGLNAFGEVVVDDTRLAQDGVLSFMYQRRSSGTTPSALRVIDFTLPS